MVNGDRHTLFVTVAALGAEARLASCSMSGTQDHALAIIAIAGTATVFAREGETLSGYWSGRPLWVTALPPTLGLVGGRPQAPSLVEGSRLGGDCRPTTSRSGGWA